MGLVLAVLAGASPAQGQGLPGGYAPERGVRLPSRLPVEDEDVLDERDDDVRPYRPGMLVRPGYHVVTTYHGALLGTGTALFAFHWVLSLVLARADLRLDSGEVVRPDARNDALMAPLIGPFIALGTERERPDAEMALFALDGVAQVGSLVMAMSGLLIEQRWVVRVEPTGVAVSTRF